MDRSARLLSANTSPGRRGQPDRSASIQNGARSPHCARTPGAAPATLELARWEDAGSAKLAQSSAFRPFAAPATTSYAACRCNFPQNSPEPAISLNAKSVPIQSHNLDCLGFCKPKVTGSVSLTGATNLLTLKPFSPHKLTTRAQNRSSGQKGQFGPLVGLSWRSIHRSGFCSLAWLVRRHTRERRQIRSSRLNRPGFA